MARQIDSLRGIARQHRSRAKLRITLPSGLTHVAKLMLD